MPGDLFGFSAYYLDILLVKEVQISDCLTIISVFNRINILHHVYFAHRLRVYLSQT